MFLKLIIQLLSLITISLAVVTPAARLNNVTTTTANLNYSNSSQFIVQVNVGQYYYYTCSPNPCQNGGYCTTNGLTFTCSCQFGFAGPYCQTYIGNNNCLNNGCPGGSICLLQPNGFYSCQCPNGYYGPLCLSSYYICNPNPCYNGGVCIQTGLTTAYCRCQIGYNGDLCQNTVNPCSQNPCQNGGICNTIYSPTQTNLYTCSCLNGFAGVNCEAVFNPCYTNGIPNCQNNGICTINYSAYPYFKCSCQYGYSGSNCQIAPSPTCNDIDPVNCPTYASRNFCTNVYSINGITIPNYCAKSCGTCIQCVDTNVNCANWKSLNYCSLYPVNIYCRKTCGQC